MGRRNNKPDSSWRRGKCHLSHSPPDPDPGERREERSSFTASPQPVATHTKAQKENTLISQLHFNYSVGKKLQRCAPLFRFCCLLRDSHTEIPHILYFNQEQRGRMEGQKQSCRDFPWLSRNRGMVWLGGDFKAHFNSKPPTMGSGH